MNYVITVLWILVWGLAGYFTVKSICAHIEKRRAEDVMVKLMLKRQKLERLVQTGKYEVVDLNTIDR
jgi:hypothetical protein